MVNDVRDPVQAGPAGEPPTPGAGPGRSTRVHRRRGMILVAIAAWNVWVWGTRIANILRDAADFSTGFVGVHLALYGGSLALAGVLAVLGLRMWREARGPAGPST